MIDKILGALLGFGIASAVSDDEYAKSNSSEGIFILNYEDANEGKVETYSDWKKRNGIHIEERGAYQVAIDYNGFELVSAKTKTELAKRLKNLYMFAKYEDTTSEKMYAKGGEIGTYFVNFYDGTDESGGNNLGRAKVEAKDLDSALMLAESDFEERESEKASEYREGGNYLQVKTPKGTLLYSDNDGWTDTQLTPVNENEFARGGSTYAEGGTTKNWVQKVEDSPDFDKGGFSREAKKRGLSTQALFNKVMKSPKRYSEKLRKQAIFMENAYKFKVTKK